MGLCAKGAFSCVEHYMLFSSGSVLLNLDFGFGFSNSRIPAVPSLISSLFDYVTCSPHAAAFAEI